MSTRIIAAVLLAPVLALLGPGCGGGDGGTSQAPAIGPHGGPVLALPGGGFVEVLVEYPQTRAKKGVKPVVAAYFLQDDLKTPLAAKPTGVSASVGSPGIEPKETVTLNPEPLTTTPAGAARYASKPVNADADGGEGEFTATVNGETFTAPFQYGR